MYPKPLKKMVKKSLERKLKALSEKIEWESANKSP